MPTVYGHSREDTIQSPSLELVGDMELKLLPILD